MADDVNESAIANLTARLAESEKKYLWVDDTAEQIIKLRREWLVKDKGATELQKVLNEQEYQHTINDVAIRFAVNFTRESEVLCF